MSALGTPDPPGQLLEKVVVIAVEAGKLILEHQRRPVVATKADSSPVTDADLAAHHYIAEHLGALDPDIPIISEEATAADYETRKEWPRFWLVDPLDGTKEFVRGSDEYTVNIALSHEQEPVLGAGVRSYLSDGDNVRYGLNAGPDILEDRHGKDFAARFGLGFSAEDREENIRRIGAVALPRVLASSRTAFISPYRRDRDAVRATLGEGLQLLDVFGGHVENYRDAPQRSVGKLHFVQR